MKPIPDLIIKSIIEAYSMQPYTKKVCDKEFDYGQFAPTKGHEHTEDCIIEIKYEIDAQVGGVLVGYNKDGKELFRYLENSVNIDFK